MQNVNRECPDCGATHRFKFPVTGAGFECECGAILKWGLSLSPDFTTDEFEGWDSLSARIRLTVVLSAREA